VQQGALGLCSASHEQHQIIKNLQDGQHKRGIAKQQQI
jgi:hypothetical protein